MAREVLLVAKVAAEEAWLVAEEVWLMAREVWLVTEEVWVGIRGWSPWCV